MAHSKGEAEERAETGLFTQMWARVRQPQEGGGQSGVWTPSWGARFYTQGQGAFPLAL
jgi:hypothetical protein